MSETDKRAVARALREVAHGMLDASADAYEAGVEFSARDYLLARADAIEDA